MTTFDGHANLAIATVAIAPNNPASGTSLQLAAGQAAQFVFPFNALVWPPLVLPTTANSEIVRVTNISGDTLTIARQQEGSRSRSILVGDQVADAITAKNFTDIEAAVNANASAIATEAARAEAAEATLVPLSQKGANSGVASLDSSGHLPSAQNTPSVELVNSISKRATVYVATDGNDSNDGLTWGHAKATIQAACDALPLGPDGISRAGNVELGYGTFTVSSYARTDTNCTVTNNSTTILDSHITSQDLHAFVDVFGTGWGSVVQITAVTPGVSFTISTPWILSSSSTQSITIQRPAIKPAPGTTIRGRGRFGNTTNVVYGTPTYATLIQDTGNGVTIWGPSGTDPDQHGYWQCEIRDLSCNGPGNMTGNASSNNMRGFYALNLGGLFIEKCDFQFHGQWAICLDANAPVAGVMRDLNVQYNGLVAATGQTGGLYLSPASTNEYELDNVRCGENFGYGAAVTSQVNCSKSIFWGSKATGFSGGGGVPPSGVGLVCWGGEIDPIVLINNEWQDSEVYDFFITAATVVHMIGGGGASVSGTAISIEQTSVLILDGVAFQPQGDSSVTAIAQRTATAQAQVSWRNCVCLFPNFIQGVGGTDLYQIPASMAAGTGSTSFYAIGLTGAQQPSRFAGATSSGAPVSGTFAVGDFVIDRTGPIWVCTVAGSPGTWVNQAGPGVNASQIVATVASSGAAQTIPDPAVVGNATVNKIALSTNCTFTFPLAAAGKRFEVHLIQGGSGSNTVTWPSGTSLLWPSGTAPTLATAVGASDLLAFECVDGTHWLGRSLGLAYPAPSLTYAQTILAETSLVSFWELGEPSGTTMVDSGTGGNAGTYHGGITLGQAGQGGQTCALFDGSTCFAAIPTASTLGALGNTFSWEAWFHATSTAAKTCAILASNGQPRLFDSNGTVSFLGSAFINSGTAAADGAWHHIVVTCNAGAVTLYLDGTSVATGSSTSALAGTSWSIGSQSASAASNPWNGLMQYVAVYSTALSSGQVAAHFAAI